MQDAIDTQTGEIVARGYSRSGEIKDLMKALAGTQAELENVEKGAENEHFRSKYVTLGAALGEIRPKLSKHGLAVCQMPINGDGNSIGVITLLVHGESGQWIDSALYVSPTKFDAQGAGSVITYLRRYALMAMVGLAPEDDDGNAASIAAPAGRAGAPQTQGRLRQHLGGGNGASAPQAPAKTPAEVFFNQIKAHIDAAETIAALNSGGIWVVTAEARALIEAVKFSIMKDGETIEVSAWDRLVERDTRKRESLIAAADKSLEDFG